MRDDTGTPSDIDLIRQCRTDHDRLIRNFRTLYDRHKGGLFSFVARFLGREDHALAEDVVQETFVRFFERASTGYPVDNPPQYLYAIARHLCSEELRKRDTRRRAEAQSIRAWPGNASGAEDSEQIEMIEQIVAELPPREKEVFLLIVCSLLAYQNAT